MNAAAVRNMGARDLNIAISECYFNGAWTPSDDFCYELNLAVKVVDKVQRLGYQFELTREAPRPNHAHFYTARFHDPNRITPEHDVAATHPNPARAICEAALMIGEEAEKVQEQEDPSLFCPGCGREAGVIFNKSNCPGCLGG